MAQACETGVLASSLDEWNTEDAMSSGYESTRQY
jgi:hypothetical protein